MVPRNSTPGGFAHIWQSKWVAIIATKTERTQIHFLSDVLIVVASFDLKVPNLESAGLLTLFTVAYLPSIAWGWVYNTLRKWGKVEPDAYTLGTFQKQDGRP